MFKFGVKSRIIADIKLQMYAYFRIFVSELN